MTSLINAKTKDYINNLVKEKLNINLIIEIGVFLHPQNIESLNFIHANIFFILLPKPDGV